MSCIGIILAGGEGTRLRPLTISTNKHLLRIGKMPMIEYPLRKLISAGIKEIHIVTGGENYQGVVKYLGSGSRWNVRITYSIQDKSGGIAQALALAEPIARKDKMVVILGDNVFEMELTTEVKKFEKAKHNSLACLFCTESLTPERFGVLKYSGKGVGEVIDIVEKPIEPPSNDIVTGIYFYTPDVFDVIRTLKPSARGELEITDVNRDYISRSKATIIAVEGKWTDCGTFETLMKAEEQARGVENV